MNSKKKYTKKQCRKLFDEKCFFCGIDDYDLLDCHRIFEGKDGGNYSWLNMATACAICHRKLHTGKIKILGHHPTSAGKWIIHYLDEKNNEQWKFQ